MRFTEPTPEQVEAFKAWVSDLPQKVREVAEKFDIWTLYRLKTTGQRVFIQSFDETGDRVTLTIGVTGEFNLVTHSGQCLASNQKTWKSVMFRDQRW